MFYFYQILLPLNKWKIISEDVLLLPNTVTLEQVEDYITGCSTSTKYWVTVFGRSRTPSDTVFSLFKGDSIW
jgi:hypothetical protein